MNYSLSKFGNSFIWTTPHFTYKEMGKSEAIAFGYWSFNIEQSEIKFAMQNLDSVHNTVYFNSYGMIEDLGNKSLTK
jgi:hypothetical protein